MSFSDMVIRWYGYNGDNGDSISSCCCVMYLSCQDERCSLFAHLTYYSYRSSLPPPDGIGGIYTGLIFVNRVFVVRGEAVQRNVQLRAGAVEGL